MQMTSPATASATATASAATASAGGASHSDHDLVAQIQRSEIFRDYQKAFESATGLPLAIRAVGSFQPPLQGSRKANGFCSLMAAQNKTCSACLQLQERIETAAHEQPATLQCFAGLSESAIPVRVGERVVAYMQTGQVMFRKPSETVFRGALRQLDRLGANTQAKALKEAYLKTRVIGQAQYESVVRLLSIFAQHLSAMSNQLMVRESKAEVPTVAKARAFIAEHQNEEISLSKVSQAVNMSAFYFCKVFKKATGLTFTEYLARVRVETVKQRLLDPHARVSEAAYEAGFQSLSQFNRVFRRIAGEAPSNFRGRVHNSEPAALGIGVAMTRAA
jgi:AraC-like DNA-binding protein/ligand-binding sensor protein